MKRHSLAALGLVVVTAACSSSSTPSSPPPEDAGPGAPPQDYAAVVRGKLATADMGAAKAAHDAIASAGEAQAKAAGNFSHQPHLGTTLLDSTSNTFLSIDRWSDATAMERFYADPKVQQAFGSLFDGPPTVQFYVRVPTWASWGDMDTGKASGTWFDHLAIGVLEDTDTEKNHRAHDAVANGGKEPSMAAGNVAHVVYLGLHDPRQFVAFDLWPKSDNIQAFYTDPRFTAAFGALFETVQQPVFESTNWQSW